jgi:hypothetical protein
MWYVAEKKKYQTVGVSQGRKYAIYRTLGLLPSSTFLYQARLHRLFPFSLLGFRVSPSPGAAEPGKGGGARAHNFFKSEKIALFLA